MVVGVKSLSDTCILRGLYVNNGLLKFFFFFKETPAKNKTTDKEVREERQTTSVTVEAAVRADHGSVWSYWLYFCAYLKFFIRRSKKMKKKRKTSEGSSLFSPVTPF